MYAIIETGGKQYRVAENEVITIERLALATGERIEFDRILAVGAGEGLTCGTPVVADAKVVGRVVHHGRGPKIHGMKHKKKKHYRRQWGHRQNNTHVLIEKIEAAGVAVPTASEEA
jgi:large subunit ribosomal protein L21